MLLEQGPTGGALSPSQLLSECVRRVTAGELTMPAATGSGQPLAPDCRLCHACFDTVFKALVYSYRAALPNSELPDAVTRRANCWYGKDCRTQAHNRQHAERLNHICAATRGGGSSRG